MNAYFDASSFVSLVLRDKGWMSIAQWVTDTKARTHLSDFGWGEFVSAVSLRVRQRELAANDAHTAIVHVSRHDIAAATEFVARFDLGLRLPDALHIALAQRLDQILVTTDLRQAIAARTLGVTVVNPLEGTQTA